MSDAPVRRKKDNKEDHNSREVSDARGRIAWKDEEQRKRNTVIYEAAPKPPADSRDLPNFTGDWMCSATSGEWDEFLYLLDVSEFTRKLAKARKWGVKHTEQRITSQADKKSITIFNHYKKLHFTTNPLKSASDASQVDADSRSKQVSMVVDGSVQPITYEGFEGKGTLHWEGKTLVTRMELPNLGPVRTCPMYACEVHS